MLRLWAFHTDWRTPSNSRFEPLPPVVVEPFVLPCDGRGGACVEQGHADPRTRLDTLSDRLMFRLAYRNLGTHESWVTNHTVAAGRGSGIRWYQLNRRPAGEGGALNVQHGTYGPDDSFRWMGSIAMDQAGNLAVGYSHSSRSTSPDLRVTGRVEGEGTPDGVLNRGESSLVEEPRGSQVYVDRWGDYSMMSVDPVDDCTFWFTGEYLKSTGYRNWNSRIVAFKFDECPARRQDDFSLSLGPEGGLVSSQCPARFRLKASLVRGVAKPVSLTVERLPPGLNASFDPAVLPAAAESTSILTLSAAQGATLPPVVPFNVVGTTDAGSHVRLGRVSVLSEGGNDFAIRLSSAAATVVAGASSELTVETEAVAGAEPVSLTVSGLPAGVSAELIPATVVAGESARLRLMAASGTQEVTAPVEVVGTGACSTRRASVSLTVSEARDFRLELNPTERAIRSGESATVSVLTEAVGTAEPISLEVLGLPSWLQSRLEPAVVTAGQRAVLHLTTRAEAPGAQIDFAVRGRSATAAHEARGRLSVVNDFSLRVEPGRRAEPGSKAAFEIQTRRESGSPEELILSVTGLPPQVSATLEPRTLLAGERARLTITDLGTDEDLLLFRVQGLSASQAHTAEGTVRFVERRFLDIKDSESEPPPALRPGETPSSCGCTPAAGWKDSAAPWLLLTIGWALARRRGA